LPMLTEQRDLREEIDERIREEELFKFFKNELTEREFKCFIARVIDEQKMDDICKEHNVSRERIYQIVRKAIRKLRTPQRLAFFIKLGGPLGISSEKRIKEVEEEERASRALYVEKDRFREQKWKQEAKSRWRQRQYVPDPSLIEYTEPPDFVFLCKDHFGNPYLAANPEKANKMVPISIERHQEWIEKLLKEDRWYAISASAKSYS
jgi:predicted DNA-binding protein YlxM (UPF0122 family)